MSRWTRRGRSVRAVANALAPMQERIEQLTTALSRAPLEPLAAITGQSVRAAAAYERRHPEIAQTDDRINPSDRAFVGFAMALPAHQAEPSWWDVLGVLPNAPLAEIEAAHGRMAILHHPDRGGDHEQMARINRARDVAREERG